ncbi:MAG: glycosyltransferase [Deltaproteobacteria bacterium]|nr:glycosyltransferase [Deltaproteobacteria bacterium]
MDRRRSICHVVTRLDRGGSAENTILTALHQRRRGHDVSVVCGPTVETGMGIAETTSVDERTRAFHAMGGRIEVCPGLLRSPTVAGEIRAFCSLLRLLRRRRPEVVHTHTTKAGVLGRLAARAAGVPWVLHTYHGHIYEGYAGPLTSWLFVQAERALAPLAHRLIALTPTEREDHLARGVGRREQFRVVPSGVDLAAFQHLPSRAEARELLGLPAGARLVGCVGRLIGLKGHRYAVEALARLAPRHPNLRLVLLGEGELLGQLQGQAATAGLAERIHFLGWRPDIPLCLAALDVFAVPSLNEGMGRVAVEAMASGLPVVASRVSGLQDVVEDGRTGLLVPASDGAALARALERLLVDPATARDLGSRGRARARTFSLEAMLGALDELVAEADEGTLLGMEEVRP